jgi:hypothetical protein
MRNGHCRNLAVEAQQSVEGIGNFCRKCQGASTVRRAVVRTKQPIAAGLQKNAATALLDFRLDHFVCIWISQIRFPMLHIH